MALDQDVVNLAKAIRQVESGNRAVLPQEKGIGGASRYQYTTSTWQSVAQKYLGDANAPLTLENENKATYLRIKDWKDAGYNPAQIASMWNAGEGRPNAYKENWRGVNSYGVAYDTPAYVNKVYAEYQRQKQLNPPITPKLPQPVTPQVETTPVEKPGLLKSIGGALISSEKGLGESLGQSVAYLTGIGKKIDENNKKLIDSGDTLLGLAKTTTDPVRKQNLINQAKQSYQLAGTSYEEVLPAIQKTGLQIAGEGLGTALDVATAGTYGGLAKGAKTGQLLTKSPKLAKAAETIGVGVTKPLATKVTLPTAAKSIATGAGIGYGYDVASKLEAGKTGASALTPGLGTAIGVALPLAGKVVSKTGVLTSKAEKTAANLSKVEDEIAKIERNYAKTRPLVDKTAEARKLIAQSDVLVGAVDDTGTISTKLKGGAIDKFKAQTIDDAEGIVRTGLQNEGIAISPNIVKEQLKKSILNSKLEGAELKRALNKIDDEVDGLAIKSNSEGYIKLENLQDAKIFTYQNVDYNKPTSKLEAKAFANAYKTLIENNSRLNIKEVNSELAKYYDAIDLLDMLDGRKVKGGKLGKYAARIGGQIAGSALGGSVGGYPGMAVGTIVGGELSAKIQGMLMSRTFGKGVGAGLKKSSVLEKATQEFPQARKLLPQKATPSKDSVIELPAKLPTVQGQVKSPSDLRTLPIKKSTKLPTKKSTLSQDPLIQKAKKYESLEEFVKAQGTPVYHGTQAKFDKFESKFATDAEGRKLNLGWGKNNFYFTTKKGEALKYATRERSPEVAKLYPKGEPNVIEAFVDIKKPFNIEIEKNAERWRKVRDGYWSDGVSDFNYHKIPKGKTKAEAFVEQLKKEGYDGIIDGQEITVFSENQIKTKSQLEEIWKQSQKSAKKPALPKAVAKSVDNNPIIMRTSIGDEKKVYRLKDFADKDGYVYHTTSPNNLDGIKKSGLKTSDGYQGKAVYFAPDEASTIGQASYDGATVRVNVNKLTPKNIISADVNGFGEPTELVYAKNILPEAIEIKTKNGWQPIIKTKSQLIDIRNKANKLPKKKN